MLIACVSPATGHDVSFTERQRRFIDEYIACGEAKAAATRAGYKSDTAVTGHRLLHNPRIVREIRRRLRRKSDRLDITADNVLREFARIAFADIGDVSDWGPGGVELRERDDLSTDVRRAVAEVNYRDSKDGTTIRVKMHDKIAALTKLADRLHLFDDPSGDTPHEKAQAILRALDEIEDATGS